jgi:hypothetical protein
LTDWTILIATLGQRQARFQRLLNHLLPQVEEAEGRVNVLAYWNNGERPLAEVRQALVDEADGAFVSFVDDDDLVAATYVSAIHRRMRDTPDIHYVGFRLQCYVDGAPLKPTHHSLRYSQWYDDEHGFYRDVSHLNPVRRELALQADFRKTTPPEDVAWADQLRGLLTVESFVNDVMYQYYSSSTDTTWRPGAVQRPRVGQYHRLAVDSPYFRYHPESAE